MEDDDDNHLDWEDQNQNDDDGDAEMQDEEDGDQIPRNADGSLDGGVALPPDSSKATASECDLVSANHQAHGNSCVYRFLTCLSPFAQDVVPGVRRRD